VNVIFHHQFLKSYQKRIQPFPKLDKQFTARLKLFKDDTKNQILRDHALEGEKQDYRAFSITGDIRVVYSLLDENTALFVDVGSHNQVY